MRTVIAGFGGMGIVHYLNTKLVDGIEVAGIVGSTVDDRRKAEEYGLSFFPSITEAFDAVRPDVIDITTPTFLHKEHILQALAAGCKAVICEKPLALSSDDARAVISAAEERDAVIIPAHVMRFTKEFKALKDVVDSAVFGKVLDASFSRISSMPKWTSGWLMDRSKSGLVPFDLHIHDLDMIFALFGKMDRVGSYKRKSTESNVDEYFHVSYIYDDFCVNAEAGWLRASVPFSASWRVIFEHGVVECKGNVMAYPENGEPYELDTHYDVVVPTGINVPPTGWYYEELSAIYSYLGSERKEPLIPYDDIVEELKILENL